MVTIIKMGCHHGTRFRRDVVHHCDTWASAQCQAAVQRAASRYGPECIRTPLIGALESPPIAAYVCPYASTDVHPLCQEEAPAAVHPPVTPVAPVAPAAPATPAAPRSALRPVGAAIGSALVVGGLYKANNLLMGQRIEPVSRPPEEVQRELAAPLLGTGRSSARVNDSWPPSAQHPRNRREAVSLAWHRARQALSQPAPRRREVETSHDLHARPSLSFLGFRIR